MALKASNKDKKLNMVYSLGAAIVILGALFKINHWVIPWTGIGGSAILAVGLITEAIIFVIFAFDPPVGDYEWEKVYPELMESDYLKKSHVADENVLAEQKLLSEKIEKLLNEAMIDAEILSGLKQSLQKFGGSVEELNQSTEDAKQVSHQLNSLSENLSSVNQAYEGMLSMKSLEKFGDSVEELHQSTEDAKKVSEQLNSLSDNLSSLNQVYGGMLSAMSGSK